MVNQWLQATEGPERLAAIEVAIDRVGGARALSKFSEEQMLDSPEMKKIFSYADGRKVLDRAIKNSNVIDFSKNSADNEITAGLANLDAAFKVSQ